MENNILVFTIFEGFNIKDEISLSIGYEIVASKYFKHEIPSVDEIDYAINNIEDELMSNKLLINQNSELVCADKMLREILKQDFGSKSSYSRTEVETLFSKYAAVSMGEPLSRYNLNLSRDVFAKILLLREIMHHLFFEKINMVD
jgi:hypothetical protein